MNSKSILLSLTFIIINICIIQAQSTIPNGGFDNWATVTNGTQTYEYPEGDWNEALINIATRFFSGDGFFEKYAEPDANGNALLVRRKPGNLNDGFIRFECDNVPLKLKGRYKFSQSDDTTDTDTLRVRVYFSKISDTLSGPDLYNSYNIRPNTREFEATIKKSDFTDFEIDLEDISTNGEHYDYAVIRLMIKGGSRNFTTTSTAVFDDLEFEYDDTVLDIDDTHIVNENIKVYPNPASQALNILITNTAISTIEIFNNLRQRVLELKPNRLEHSIDISKLTPGVYFVKVNDTVFRQIFK